MYCYKCKNKLDLPSKKKGFKDICSFCEADLHVCKNCRHYLVGKPNDCNVLTLDFVSDKEKYNFCEDFLFKETLEEENNKTKKDISKKLFKDDDDDDLKDTSFDSLFKD